MAEPLSPLGAQFSNPAGLTGFDDTAIGGGGGLAYGKGVITASYPPGYQATNEVLVPFLESYLVVPRGRWTFGLSSMGTSGSKYDYGARPELGVNDGFFSETGMFAVPVGAGYRVNDQWSVGAQLAPLYGSTHLRYTSPTAEFPDTPIRFRYTVSGFGVQAMVGVQWKPDDAWAFGFSVKPPGRLWADGDQKVPGGKQDVTLNLEVPTEFSLGVRRTLFTRWKATYSVRFTDSSTLSRSWIRFDETPSANMPYLPGARDEWRHGLGLQYAWSDHLLLLGGFAKANAIVSRRGVSPFTYDTKDIHLTVGARWDGDTWILAGGFAYMFGSERHIDPDEALVMPGDYDSKPAYFLLLTVGKKF